MVALFYIAGIDPEEMRINSKLFIGGAQILAMTLFTIFLWLCLCNIKLNARLLVFIGGISYEVYLLHMKIRYFYFDTWRGNDFFVYLILVFISSILFKYLADFVRKIIL